MKRGRTSGRIGEAISVGEGTWRKYVVDGLVFILIGIQSIAVAGDTASLPRLTLIANSAGSSQGQGVLLGVDQFRFRVAGAPGDVFVIEAGGDLKNWAPLRTNTVSTAGYFDFVDSLAGVFPRRYYRVRVPAAGPVLNDHDGPGEGRILVKPIPGLDLSVLNVLLGTTVLHTFPAIGDLQIVRTPPGQGVENLLAVFRQSGLVQYAEPDLPVRALVAATDPAYAQGLLWGLNNTGQDGGVPDADIDAPEGWAVQNSASEVLVAVIDTGVRYTHEDLKDNMWRNPGESGGGKENNGQDDDGDGLIDDVYGMDATVHHLAPDGTDTGEGAQHVVA